MTDKKIKEKVKRFAEATSSNNNDPKENNKKVAASITVGTNNYLSDLLFFWVFFLITALRRTKNIKDLYLLLRECDTASYNDDRLEKRWEQEKQAAKLKDRYPFHILKFTFLD
jgi:hypothetical protein